MHWYSLAPFDELIFRNIKPFTPSGQIWESADRFPPSGRSIVAALQELLQENIIVTLQGSFLCRENVLHFPRPFSYSGTQQLQPILWLQQQAAALGQVHSSDRLLWDRRKPVPLLRERLDEQISDAYDLQAQPISSPVERHFLSDKTLLKLLTNQPLASEDWHCRTGEHPQPWTVETRLNSHSSQVEQLIRLNSGWKLTIALDAATHEKLKRLGDILLIRVGEEQHQFWLEFCNEPLKQQWQDLQTQSRRNRQLAEQALAQNSGHSKILAYLATPGVFERKHADVATCRAFPWEWDLAYPLDQNQHQGPLVSVATAKPLPLNCRSLSKAASAKSVLLSQVFAVPAGSVYYLEYPADLFQDQPVLQNGRPNWVHIWRQLGYSEILWLPHNPSAGSAHTTAFNMTNGSPNPAVTL